MVSGTLCDVRSFALYSSLISYMLPAVIVMWFSFEREFQRLLISFDMEVRFMPLGFASVKSQLNLWYVLLNIVVTNL